MQKARVRIDLCFNQIRQRWIRLQRSVLVGATRSANGTVRDPISLWIGNSLWLCSTQLLRSALGKERFSTTAGDCADIGAFVAQHWWPEPQVRERLAVRVTRAEQQRVSAEFAVDSSEADSLQAEALWPST
jgi:hypothetical protein